MPTGASPTRGTSSASCATRTRTRASSAARGSASRTARRCRSCRRTTRSRSTHGPASSALEWSLTDNLLTYATISRGFKTGGFFGGFPTNVAQLAPFDAETLWGLELGVKSDLADGRLRLNASVFSYDREDVQQNAGDPTSPIQIKRITNIGDVDTVGAEAEVTWLATDRLLLNLGVGATDAEVSDSTFIQAASLPFLPDTPMEGSNLPNYSDLSVNFVGRYDGSFGARLGWFAQLEGRYQSEQDLSIITNPVEVPVFQEPGYSLWNVRFGLSGDAWAAQLYVNNASDETYRMLARNDGAFGIHELYGMPRSYGVELRMALGLSPPAAILTNP